MGRHAGFNRDLREPYGCPPALNGGRTTTAGDARGEMAGRAVTELGSNDAGPGVARRRGTSSSYPAAHAIGLSLWRVSICSGTER